MNRIFLICEGGTLAMTSKALIYRPPGSKIKWSMDLKRIKDLKREPSGYLSSGKIQFRVDVDGDGNFDDGGSERDSGGSLIWQCQVCEEINESNNDTFLKVSSSSSSSSRSSYTCKICGSVQKGSLLKVKIDENNGQNKPISIPWACEVCEDLNEAQSNSCTSCGFGRPKLKVTLNGEVEKFKGDWVCTNCTFINTHTKEQEQEENSLESMICQVCEAPKLKNNSNEIKSSSSSSNFYKLSFRSGGSTPFFDKLFKLLSVKTEKESLLNSESNSNTNSLTIGISGLLKRQEERNLATEASLSSAFSDLDGLMRTAEEMVQLATKLSDKLRSNCQLKTGDDLSIGERNTLKDLVESLGIESMTETSHEFNENGSSEFYISIAHGVSKLVQAMINKTGSRIYSLADIYCIYNRTRTTGSLIAPGDLVRAAKLMSKMNLPIRLHQFSPKGILCLVPVQDVDPLHLYTLIKQILHEKETENLKINNENNENYYLTAVDLAEKLKISLFLAGQQLKMAESAGKIVRDSKRKDLPSFFRNKFLF